MSPPNHNPVLELYKSPEKAKIASRRYPLLHLMLPDSPSCGLPAKPLFVAELHGLVRACERAWDVPPTWMDPEVFVRMCKDTPGVMELAKKVASSKRPDNLKELTAAIVEVFEEQYLLFVVEEFEKAAPLVAEWLRAHAADRDKRKAVDGKRRAK